MRFLSKTRLSVFFCVTRVPSAEVTVGPYLTNGCGCLFALHRRFLSKTRQPPRGLSLSFVLSCHRLRNDCTLCDAVLHDERLSHVRRTSTTYFTADAVTTMYCSSSYGTLGRFDTRHDTRACASDKTSGMMQNVIFHLEYTSRRDAGVRRLLRVLVSSPINRCHEGRSSHASRRHPYKAIPCLGDGCVGRSVFNSYAG